MIENELSGAESAAVYARHNGYFSDHREAPFRLKDVVWGLKSRDSKSSQGASTLLIDEPGLKNAPIPQAKIEINESLDDEDLHGPLEFDDADGETLVVPPPLASSKALLKDLQLPLELPELTSDPSRDLFEYHRLVKQKRSVDLFSQWLPISPTNDEQDEGLRFPEQAKRFHLLLLREIKHEQIEVTDESAALDQEIEEFLSGDAPTAPFYHLTGRSEGFEAKPLTPPLSPISEKTHHSPYQPSPRVCAIDLTSEPSSPVLPRVSQLENSIKDCTFESDPPVCDAVNALVLQSPSLPLCCVEKTVNPKDLELDVPLVATNSSLDNSAEENILKRPGLLDNLASSGIISEGSPGDSFFDDAFRSTLEAHKATAEMFIYQERFNTVASITRVSVPKMNFNIDNAPWTEHVSCAKDQFAWIQRQQPSSEDPDVLRREACSVVGLPWAPVKSYGQGSNLTQETLEPLSGEAEGLLHVDPVPELDSSKFVTGTTGWRIERLEAEEELRGRDEDEDMTEACHFIQSKHFKPQDAEAGMDSSAASLDSLLAAAASKRRRTWDSEATGDVLMGGTVANPASKLLSAFMDIRAVKKPRATATPGSGRTRNSCCLPEPLADQKNEKGENDKQSSLATPQLELLIPALAPELDIPEEKCGFVISLGLGRSILRHLEASWQASHLFDRDYSRYNNIAWTPGSTRRVTIPAPPSFDADIALSPTVGIIVTTLLKAKQKPLPKAKTLPQLRDQVLRVSPKYETLFVLVSECNSAGEFTSELLPSDAAAYADFVRFTVGLRAGVTSVVVPGSDRTMARWILSLMCRYSPHSLSVKAYLNTVESTWEVFFRRAGMNAFAAQVLAGAVLEKGGSAGLASLMSSSRQQIMGTFGDILGGKKALADLADVLCTPWA